MVDMPSPPSVTTLSSAGFRLPCKPGSNHCQVSRLPAQAVSGERGWARRPSLPTLALPQHLLS